ncbi:MAG: redox-sensing transcriptional repressor Rex [Deltaproteobacteria bacterium]|nr:redox-sensing transcriptional repressor Rex [Deltaproteobacteria bacterium]
MSISPPTLNRLCLYLRSLKRLQEDGVQQISSQKLAERFHLSAAQIRKDLAHFGAFGVRGVGYQVDELIPTLTSILRLDRRYRVVVVGMGNLGRAFASHPGFNRGPFVVVAGVDSDPAKIGETVNDFVVRDSQFLEEVTRESGAEIGVLTVPAHGAQENYERLAKAGVKGVLNFAPTRIRTIPGVPLKDVDLRIYLEELAYYLPFDDS